MFPTQFAYHRPDSVEEAVRLLGEVEDAKILAGGHSLIPAMKLRLAAPAALVDLGRIEALRGVRVAADVTIGAMTTYRELQESAELRQRLPMLAEAAGRVGDPQVRAKGTIGGTLAHADPAADLTAVFLALGGEVTAVGPNGQRTITADDFFVDFLTTALEPDEVLTEIRIPVPGEKVGMAYEKHPHPASGYAVVGVAAVVARGDGGTVETARLAVTGATPKATRLSQVEQALTGRPLTAESVGSVAEGAAQGLEINGDLYASEAYRRHLIGVLTRRALTRAMNG